MFPRGVVATSASYVPYGAVDLSGDRGPVSLMFSSVCLSLE